MDPWTSVIFLYKDGAGCGCGLMAWKMEGWTQVMEAPVSTRQLAGMLLMWHCM